MSKVKQGTIAVIQVGGRQHVVHPGDHVRLPGYLSDKKTHQFSDLLSGKKVSASVVGSQVSKKVTVRKFKSKVRYLRRRGYHEKVTTVKVEKVG